MRIFWSFGPDMAGRGRPWPAMTGHARPWTAMTDNGWPWEANHGWPWTTSNGWQWLAMAENDQLWLASVVGSRSYLVLRDKFEFI